MGVNQLKYAVCSELLSPLSFDKACGLCADLGFTGIEIAPFSHFDALAGAIAEAKRISGILRNHSLECIGFHWILKAPQPVLLFEKSDSSRRRAWDVIKALAELCREMGGGFLVLGSGKERSFPGTNRDMATKCFLEELQNLLPLLEKLGIALLIEPLPKIRTNFINTLSEARSIIEVLDSPVVASIFDFHNCGDETEDWASLATKNIDIIRHVHLNNEDGRVPTQYNEEFKRLFHTLVASGYSGWVSLETFDAGDPRKELEEAKKFIVAIEEGFHEYQRNYYVSHPAR